MTHLLQIAPKEFPSQRMSIQAMHAARAEYERIETKQLVQRAMRTIPPPASAQVFTLGSFAYAYREKINQYTGPHFIASVQGKQVRLTLETLMGREGSTLRN